MRGMYGFHFGGDQKSLLVEEVLTFTHRMNFCGFFVGVNSRVPFFGRGLAGSVP
jgi:hypothetical protein